MFLLVHDPCPEFLAIHIQGRRCYRLSVRRCGHIDLRPAIDLFFLVGKTLGYVPLPRTQEETQQLLHTPSCLPEFWFVTERVFSHTLWASPSLPPGRVYTECGQ